MEEVVDWTQSLLCGSHLPAEHGSGPSPGPGGLLVTHVVEDEPWTDEPWTCSLLAARERRTATCDSRLWSLALSFHSKFRARCRHFSCWSTKTLSTLEHLSSTAAEWSASCRTWSLRSSTNLLIIPFQESLAACGIVAGKSFANASASEFCKGTGGATTTGDRSGLLTVLMSSTFCPHLSDRNNVKAMTKFSSPLTSVVQMQFSWHSQHKRSAYESLMGTLQEKTKESENKKDCPPRGAS